MATKRLHLIVLVGLVAGVFCVGSAFGRGHGRGWDRGRAVTCRPHTRVVFMQPHHRVFVRPTFVFTWPTTTTVVTQQPAAEQTITVWITNSNGSKSAVTLVKDQSGPGFFGPRGEYYSAMPTECQLAMVYGIGN